MRKQNLYLCASRLWSNTQQVHLVIGHSICYSIEVLEREYVTPIKIRSKCTCAKSSYISKMSLFNSPSSNQLIHFNNDILSYPLCSWRMYSNPWNVICIEWTCVTNPVIGLINLFMMFLPFIIVIFPSGKLNSWASIN